MTVKATTNAKNVFGTLWGKSCPKEGICPTNSLSQVVPRVNGDKGLQKDKKKGQWDKDRDVVNVKNFPRRVKGDFYDIVRALNAYDRDRKAPYSPLNGEIAAEMAWAEEDKRRNR
jgi:hypothetical protein